MCAEVLISKLQYRPQLQLCTLSLLKRETGQGQEAIFVTLEHVRQGGL